MPDLTSMSAAVGALLKERQQTIAVTESSCGGLISASLVAVPGCSAFYVGGCHHLYPYRSVRSPSCG